jgi:hypothetical protein
MEFAKSNTKMAKPKQQHQQPPSQHQHLHQQQPHQTMSPLLLAPTSYIGHIAGRK